MADRLVNMVLPCILLRRTFVGMMAQFCFLESQDHWLLVQSLYILIIFCTV